MCFHDVLNIRQPKAKAFYIMDISCGHTIKFLKDVPLLIPVHPYPFVLHGEAELIV